jgi:hypothetical protein
MPFCDCKQNGGNVLEYLVILSLSVCRHIFFLLEHITRSHIDAAATTAVLLCNPKFYADGM